MLVPHCGEDSQLRSGGCAPQKVENAFPVIDLESERDGKLAIAGWLLSELHPSDPIPAKPYEALENRSAPGAAERRIGGTLRMGHHPENPSVRR